MRILKEAAAALLLTFIMLCSSPSVLSAGLTITLDSDTSLYSAGEAVSINVSGPPSVVSVTVTGPSGLVFRNDSLVIGPSGTLVVNLSTVGLPTGSYNITANGTAGIAQAAFRLVQPFGTVSCYAVSATGEPLSAQTPIYYYFNGSVLSMIVNVSAPNDHVAAEIDLGWLGYGILSFSPAGNGTWAKGTNPDGSGWYAFLVSRTVPAGFLSRGIFEIPILIKVPAGPTITVNSTSFKSVINFQPVDYDTRLGGSTTDWRGIKDFTNASGIVFEFFNGSSPVARISYVHALNLCDPVTVNSLLRLGEHLWIGAGTVGVNASALPALDAPANISMYGLTFQNQPGVLFNGSPAVRTGQSSGGPVRTLFWDAISGTLDLQVERMGEYTADGDPPYLAYSEPREGSFTGDPTPSVRILARDAIAEVSQLGIVLRVDGAAISPVIGAAPPKGLWVNATTGLLEDGWHTFTATVSDVLGNTAVLALRVAVDTTPPEVAGYLPFNGSYVGEPMPRVSANFTDALSGVSHATLTINSWNATTGIGETMDFKPSFNFTEGVYNATIEVFDTVGNAYAFTWEFTVDLTPPVIAYFHPERAMIVPYNDSVYAGFEDNYGVNMSRISLRIDGEEVIGFANLSANALLYYPSPPLSKGMHDAELRVYDFAGNNATEAWSFRVDDIPPTVTETKPLNGSVITDRTLTISATLFDNLEVKPESVRLRVDGVDRTPQATITKTSASCQLILDLGVHAVEITLADTSDNINTVFWTFTIKEPEPIPPEMIRDIIIMVILIVAVVAVLLLVFMMGTKRKQRY
ncbi:MAG: hypothetical protein ACQXXL_01705 [Candidatus Methanosuratincola sp.]|nr:Ig-like domain-containing protein [Candidatus Methanosuratincola sp.]